MANSKAKQDQPSPTINVPSFFVKFRRDLTAVPQKDGGIALFRNGGKVLEVPDIPLIEELRKNWMAEESIDRLAEISGNAPAFYFLTEKLFSLDLLQMQCRSGGQALFTFQPAPGWQAWRKIPSAPFRRPSPFLCLRQEGNSLMLEMPLSQRTCLLHDETCLLWLMEMIRERVPPPAEDEARKAFYRALYLMNALEEKPAHPIWEFHDLLFFSASSIGFHDAPIGAT